jgi:hypothetical protein
MILQGDNSIRMGVFLENVMDTINQADELGGLEGMDYINAMLYISKVVNDRAEKALNLISSHKEN